MFVFQETRHDVDRDASLKRKRRGRMSAVVKLWDRKAGALRGRLEASGEGLWLDRSAVQVGRDVRQELLRHHQQKTTDDMVNRQTTRMVVTDMARGNAHAQALARVGQVIVNYLERRGTVNKSDVHRYVGRDRPLFADALARLVSRGVVIAEGNTFRLKSP